MTVGHDVLITIIRGIERPPSYRRLKDNTDVRLSSKTIKVITNNLIALKESISGVLFSS